MATETKTLQCGSQDPALKAQLADEADERGESINDVAVSILAARFGIAYEGSGRKSPGFRGSAAGAYRMPRKLWLAISNAATAGETTKRAVVELALRDHFETNGAYASTCETVSPS